MTILDESADIAERPDAGDARGVVVLARRAPSVFNTQPWRWRIDGNVLQLRADRDRQLRVSDPAGRNLMISCGAALHHALVAAAGFGRAVSVERFPDPAEPDLLAVLQLGEASAVTSSDAALLDALSKRQTDRRRFTSWPVPEDRLDTLAQVARGRGARVLTMKEPATRATVELLVDLAIDVQEKKRAYSRERKAWVARADDQGIPATSLPRRHPSQPRDRFNREQAPTARHGNLDDRRATVTDQVLAICTPRDDVASWLDAGETLSALWLHATLGGLSVVPLSQVVEVQETRAALREEIFVGMAHPQVLARIGWLPITRPLLVSTPRRRLADVTEGLPVTG